MLCYSIGNTLIFCKFLLFKTLLLSVCVLYEEWKYLFTIYADFKYWQTCIMHYCSLILCTWVKEVEEIKCTVPINKHRSHSWIYFLSCVSDVNIPNFENKSVAFKAIFFLISNVGKNNGSLFLDFFRKTCTLAFCWR